MILKNTVAVIIPTYNGEEWVEEAVLSVVNQSYGFINIYIIDDGSTDKTLNILNKLCKLYRNIILCKKKGIRGAPSSRMEVLLTLEEKYVSFIDQDDIWNKDKIKKQMKEIETYGYDLIHTDILIINEHSQQLIKVQNKENKKRKKFNYKLNSRQLTSKFILYNPIRIGTVLARTESLMSIKGFDLSIEGGEDWHCWVRFTHFGNSIGYINEPLATRRIHGKNTSVVSREKRMRGWLIAAKKLSYDYPSLNNQLQKFYLLTFLRYIYSSLRHKNRRELYILNSFLDLKVFSSSVYKPFLYLIVYISKIRYLFK